MWQPPERTRTDMTRTDMYGRALAGGMEMRGLTPKVL